MFIKGSFLIGFEINKQRKFVLTVETYKQGLHPRGIIIGMYNSVFNLRSEYVYKAAQICVGYTIKKKPFKMLINNHDKVAP